MAGLPLVGLLGACGNEAAERPAAPPPGHAERSALLERLEDPNPTVRLEAANALLERSDLDAEACPVLIRALRDENRWIRDRAARLLDRLGPAAASAVEALHEALLDPDGFVRWRSAKALASIGPAARPALARLRGMAEDKDETELGRSWAGEAVRAIEGD